MLRHPAHYAVTRPPGRTPAHPTAATHKAPHRFTLRRSLWHRGRAVPLRTHDSRVAACPHVAEKGVGCAPCMCIAAQAPAPAAPQRAPRTNTPTPAPARRATMVNSQATLIWAWRRVAVPGVASVPVSASIRVSASPVLQHTRADTRRSLVRVEKTGEFARSSGREASRSRGRPLDDRRKQTQSGGREPVPRAPGVAR